MSGHSIGPYRVLSLISSGGEGTVYVGYDRRLKRQVALKFVAMPQQREMREEVIVEARALARLNHRSIVQIFDLVETRNYLVLVMEYVPGLDLKALAGQVVFSQATAVQLGVSLCSALAAAQRAGIVHRDLKLANVLVASTGQVKLVDFGIALKPDQNRAGTEGATAGTPQAMSPEHVAGSELDTRADVFALGLILYRCLAGCHPFGEATNGPQLLRRLRDNDHIPLHVRDSAIAVELSALIDDMLAKDPRQRIPDALTVRHELLRIKQTIPVYQGATLAAVMGGRSREITLVGHSTRLPAGLSGPVRSRLLSRAEWGRWGRPRPAVMVACGLALMALVLAPLLFWVGAGKALQPVELRRPIITAGSMLQGLPPVADLHSHMGQALAATGRFSAAGKTANERLHTRIRCNPYLCELRLIRERNGEREEDYSVLLSGVPASAWRISMEQAVARLYL